VKSGSHLVGESVDDDQTDEAVKIVAGDADVHHFDGAGCEAEGHGSDGATTSLVHQIINLQHHELCRLRHVDKRGSTREREM